jgi:hypothetical protein
MENREWDGSMRIELTNTNEEEEHGQHQTARPERSGNGAIVIQHSRLARPRPVSLSSRFNHPQSAHFPSVPYSRARRMHHSRIAIAHRAQLLPIHLRKPEPEVPMRSINATCAGARRKVIPARMKRRVIPRRCKKPEQQPGFGAARAVLEVRWEGAGGAGAGLSD